MKKLDGLEELWRFVLNTDNRLRQNQPVMFQHQEANAVFNLITKVADAIKDDYPFYSDELPQIVRNTFLPMGKGFYGLNTAAFGELFILTKHLRGERLDFLVSLTSKIALGFGIWGSEIAGPYSRASHLRKRGCHTARTGKPARNFKPKGRFRSERGQKNPALTGTGCRRPSRDLSKRVRAAAKPANATRTVARDGKRT